MEHKINIIYNIWINNNRNWKIIIEGQLCDIKLSKILDKSKLYIIISSDEDHILSNSVEYINTFLDIFDSDKEKVNIYSYNKNYYEYYGVKKIYDLAKNEPDKLYIYFHTKGMFNWYNNDINKRSEDEFNLTYYLIHGWRDILNVFENYADINRIGLIPSNGGWMWFNFYWTRGNYLNTCEEPLISENRYYYESWLGSGNQEIGSIYGTLSGNFKKYTAEEAIEIIENLRYKISI